jgi:hypothetical protein
LKILIVGFKYNHHSENSGYDKFIEYLSLKKEIKFYNLYKYLFFKNSNNLILNILHRLNHRILLYFLKFYIENINHYDLIHFIYPEDTLKKVRIKPNVKTKILATFHQPSIWFEKLTNKEIKNLSIVKYSIILGKTQENSIKQVLKINNPIFIPHGVENNFFKNLKYNRCSNRILVVGSWLRDIDLLYKIISFHNESSNSVVFDIVLGANSNKFLEKMNNCILHTNINNDELVNLYNTATIVLFVLNDSVANNALLESISTGNAIIINDVGSVTDYINNDSALLIKKDFKKYNESIFKLLNDSILLENYRTKSFNLSINFSWEKISNDIYNKYYSILNDN